MKSWLQDINVEMYSPHNERKSVVAGRFIRTLKNKIYKYMNLISKNVYNKCVVNKHNNTYSTIKMKPVDVHLCTYINFDVEKNDKDPKFKLATM